MERNRVFYEWDIEYFNPVTQNIEDHNHSSECPGIPTEPDLSLVLVRDTYSMHEGEPFDLEYRTWAYIEGNHLPETFDDGVKVPQKFHKELEKAESES